MRSPAQGQVVGIPVNSNAEAITLYSLSTPYRPCLSKHDKSDSLLGWMNSFSRRADTYTKRLREHVNLGPKITETIKGKLSLGARILQAGGMERVFRQLFTVGDGEKLLKAFQCYLSTSAGPIAGLLFISTARVAFHSERPIRLSSAEGEVIRIPYKVVIPLEKIRKANPNEDIVRRKQKYIQISTVDGFEFWFMGFLSYHRTLRWLQKVMLQPPFKFF